MYFNMCTAVHGAVKRIAKGTRKKRPLNFLYFFSYAIETHKDK